MSERKTMDEYIEDDIWVKRSKKYIRILVYATTWNGPHTAELSLEIGRELPSSASQEEVHQAVSEVLNDPNFFLVCAECGKRKTIGLMEGDICMDCAVNNHGIKY